MSSEALKPCPFCGGEAENTGPDKALVNCASETCSMHWAWFNVDWWNRRSPSPAVLALVEACKGLVPTLRSGDWGNQDETANEIDEAIAAVEREIGGKS